MTRQPLKMQGRGFLGEAWQWVKERAREAGEIADEIFRQPPSAGASIGARGMRGLLAQA
jgi:hypothetical protein